MEIKYKGIKIKVRYMKEIKKSIVICRYEKCLIYINCDLSSKKKSLELHKSLKFYRKSINK